MRPDISITTVLYNSADYLRNCFASTREDVQSGFAELLAVDNASPDQSAQIVASEFPFAKLITSVDNLGFAGGCNLSLPHVNGRYWLLLNPDTIVPANGLRELVKWMDEHPEIGAASADIVDSDGTTAYPARRFPSLSLSLLEMSRLHRLLPKDARARILRGNYWTEDADQTDADWVPGTALIVRREVIEAVGSLSEQLFMYGEDIEWCWRIRRAGWKIGVCSKVKIFHQGKTSAEKTWGSAGTNLRMQRATYQAIKMMRGKTYGSLLLLLDTVAQLIESYRPFNPKPQRAAARQQLKSYLTLLTKRAGGKPKASK